jgi:chemotaxis protein histidine kinase CheA
MYGCKIINKGQFEDFTGADANMVALFRSQCVEYYQELTSAHASGDIHNWHDTAHKFKGMASFSGAERLYETCHNAQTNYNTHDTHRGAILADIKYEMDLAMAEFTMMGL